MDLQAERCWSYRDVSDRCSSYREVLELQGGVGATEMCQRGVGERMSQVSGGWGVVEAVD